MIVVKDDVRDGESGRRLRGVVNVPQRQSIKFESFSQTGAFDHGIPALALVFNVVGELRD